MATSIPTISSSELSSLLLDPSPKKNLKIIDVRDHDHIGGHILTSTHHPSTSLPESLPKLLSDCKDAHIVVFHCALSQQRGPTAAKSYASARREREGQHATKQEIYVLDRGFVGWQEVYGEDKRLTEGYVKDLWRDGY